MKKNRIKQDMRFHKNVGCLKKKKERKEIMTFLFCNTKNHPHVKIMLRKPQN